MGVMINIVFINNTILFLQIFDYIENKIAALGGFALTYLMVITINLIKT